MRPMVRFRRAGATEWSELFAARPDSYSRTTLHAQGAGAPARSAEDHFRGWGFPTHSGPQARSATAGWDKKWGSNHDQVGQALRDLVAIPMPGVALRFGGSY